MAVRLPHPVERWPKRVLTRLGMSAIEPGKQAGSVTHNGSHGGCEFRSDAGEPECVEELPEAHRPSFFDFSQNVGCGFLAHAFQTNQPLHGKPIEVGCRDDKSRFKELFDEFFTHAVQFQSTAPIEHRSAGSCVAQEVGALQKRSFKHDIAAASRAGGGRRNRSVIRQRSGERFAVGVMPP